MILLFYDSTVLWLCCNGLHSLAVPGLKGSLLPSQMTVLTPSCFPLPSVALGLLFPMLRCLDVGKVQPRVYWEVQLPFCYWECPLWPFLGCQMLLTHRRKALVYYSLRAEASSWTSGTSLPLHLWLPAVEWFSPASDRFTQAGFTHPPPHILI